MALTQISYPVTGSVGSYKNIFPSQKPQFMEFTRVDAVISTVTSGVDSKVRITISGTFDSISIGQFVTWKTDGYPLRSSKVISIISSSAIEVDEVFSSSSAANGFINYLENWFVEIRYVAKTSASNDQDALEIISDYSQVPNSNDGNVKANISLPSDLIDPDFDLETGIAPNLFVEYKVQYRESHKLDRSKTWNSPTNDIPILLVHASQDFENGFSDPSITKRYYRGYPVLYSFVYSSINDNGVNDLGIYLKQYSISKLELASTQIDSITNFNGVYLILVDSSSLDDATIFINFEFTITSNSSQFDPSQFDPSQFA